MESPSSFSATSSPTNPGLARKQIPVREQNVSNKYLQGRNKMVVNKVTTSKRKSDSVTISRYNNLHRRIQNGLGVVSNGVGTNGKWSAQERMLHINVLELKGALLAIQALLKNQRQITVSLNMDNSTAVSYINHKGGTHSMELVQLTLKLWDWCILRDIYLIARHVPGKTNTLADRESREFRDEPNWKLDPLDPQVIKPFLSGCRTSFCHQIDSSIEAIHQLETRSKSTQLRCSECELERSGGGGGGYAFPPFNLVPAVLNKVLTDQTEIVLVAPVWQAQMWWPLLLSLLTEEPVLLPNT